MRYKCRKISNKLIINGNLRKAQWEAAEGIRLVDTVTGLESNNQTIAKFLWNDTFLYVGFYCRYEQISATMSGFNEKLYEEDVVEVFIDDNSDRRTYMEIEVNPLNAVLHYYIQNDLAGTILQYARVNNNIISAVIQDQEEKEFMVELAIPFTEFITASSIPPETGDIWLFNAYRINNSFGDDVEYLACSPTGMINFHIPNCFGELEYTNIPIL
ncbi:carbohydrate-binding family 9-like protein [Lacrimispora sp.]|uniref:carbohydrate-binding family 9-like protein n=1 Tax=Lacrimispora sp. TaxID=2719234 RepID=UPI0032E4EC4D